MSVKEWISDLIYPEPVVDDVVVAPLDTSRIIRTGTDYALLKECPGYQRLLDDLESRANRCLAMVRGNLSSDPVLAKSLVDRWREAEESLHFIQTTVEESIQRRVQVLQDLGEQMGYGTGFDMDAAADARSMEDFVYGRTKHNQHNKQRTEVEEDE